VQSLREKRRSKVSLTARDALRGFRYWCNAMEIAQVSVVPLHFHCGGEPGLWVGLFQNVYRFTERNATAAAAAAVVG